MEAVKEFFQLESDRDVARVMVVSTVATMVFISVVFVWAGLGIL